MHACVQTYMHACLDWRWSDMIIDIDMLYIDNSICADNHKNMFMIYDNILTKSIQKRESFKIGNCNEVIHEMS